MELYVMHLHVCSILALKPERRRCKNLINEENRCDKLWIWACSLISRAIDDDVYYNFRRLAKIEF